MGIGGLLTGRRLGGWAVVWLLWRGVDGCDRSGTGGAGTAGRTGVTAGGGTTGAEAAGTLAWGALGREVRELLKLDNKPVLVGAGTPDGLAVPLAVAAPPGAVGKADPIAVVPVPGTTVVAPLG